MTANGEVRPGVMATGRMPFIVSEISSGEREGADSPLART